MTPKALRALHSAIAHWEENLASAPDGVSVGVRRCALCNLFLQEACEGCPVAEATGQTRCNNSPYMGVLDALDIWDSEQSEDNSQNVKQAVQAELDFLKSLVPARVSK